jgi:hypothetical protein
MRGDLRRLDHAIGMGDPAQRNPAQKTQSQEENELFMVYLHVI